MPVIYNHLVVAGIIPGHVGKIQGCVCRPADLKIIRQVRAVEQPFICQWRLACGDDGETCVGPGDDRLALRLLGDVRNALGKSRRREKNGQCQDNKHRQPSPSPERQHGFHLYGSSSVSASMRLGRDFKVLRAVFKTSASHYATKIQPAPMCLSSGWAEPVTKRAHTAKTRQLNSLVTT